MLGKRLGQGNTAEVYEWGTAGNRVLKLFRHPSLTPHMEREYQLSAYVAKLGLPVPGIYGIEEIEGRRGIVYERIEGETQTLHMVKRPWSVKAEGRRLAEWHAVIHQEEADAAFPRRKEQLREAIQQSPLLTEEQKRMVLEQLLRLPEGSALCHGDFHPDNVLMSPRGAVLLDWMTASSGHPYSDAARTLLVLKHAALPVSMPKVVKALLQKLRSTLCEAYQERYQELTGAAARELTVWLVPLAAERLTESIPEDEKRRLLELISRPETMA